MVRVRFLPDGEGRVRIQDVETGFFLNLRMPVEGSVEDDVVGMMPLED
jgi:hypothetical protein